MEIIINSEKIQNLYQNLGDKITKEGNLPPRIQSDAEKKAAEYECRRFLLNYQFQMWENLVVVYLMYQSLKITKLFFEDLEDSYYRFIHDVLPKQILENYLERRK